MNDKILTLYKGIETSIPEKSDVVVLYIEAVEADDFFYWVASSAKSVSKLKSYFSNLKKVIIEDDCLNQAQLDALLNQLSPIEIEWVQKMHISGRNGR